jgi:hypothetical protein
MQKSQLFSIKDERLNASFLSMAAMLLAFSILFTRSISIDQHWLFFSVFLLDALFVTGHIALSYVLVKSIPEVHAGLNRMGLSKRRMLFRLSSFFLLFFLVFLSLNFFAKNNGLNAVYMYETIILVAFCHHDIAQKFGICCLYNEASRDDLNVPLESLKARGKRERWLFRCVLLLVLVNIFLFGRGHGTTFGGWLEIFGQDFLLYKIVASLILLGLIGALVVLTGDAGVVRRQKKLFLTRLLFYVLVPFIPVAFFAVRFLHASEYFIINKNILKNSRVIGNGWLASFLVFIFTIAALHITSAIPLATRSLYRPPTALLSVFTSVYFAVIFLHYYLDRLIFRMGNVGMRESLRALLLSN